MSMSSACSDGPKGGAVEGPDPSGLTVLITAGEFTGSEAVCLGRAADNDTCWAVSPDDSAVILELRFPEDFGVLVNSRQRPGIN